VATERSCDDPVSDEPGSDDADPGLEPEPGSAKIY
jgi:hypothetical protein